MADAPSDAELRQAYRVLGISLDTATTADSVDQAAVKKKFIELAKTHHPDANSTSSTSTSQARMTEINHAYKTIQDFFKAGGKAQSLLPSARAGARRGGGGGGSGPYDSNPFEQWAHPDMQASYWEGFAPPGAGPVYAPEDFAMTPDEFMAFHDAFGHADHFPPFSSWEQEFHSTFHQSPPRHPKGQQHHSRHYQEQEPPKAEPRPSSKFSPVEQKALANMHQDGKSFEFIANALGKTVSDVIEEFNAQHESSSDAAGSGRKNHRPQRGHQRRQRQRQQSQFVEFDDEEDLFDFMETHGDGSVFFVDGIPVTRAEFARKEKRQTHQSSPRGSASPREREDDRRMRQEYEEFLNATPYRGNVHQHNSFDRNPERQQPHRQQQQGGGRGRGRGSGRGKGGWSNQQQRSNRGGGNGGNDGKTQV